MKESPKIGGKDLVKKYSQGEIIETDVNGFKEIAKMNEIAILKQRISHLRDTDHPLLPETVYYGIWRERELYFQEYGISWEELGISEQEFIDLCKQAMQRGVLYGIERYRKKTYHPSGAQDFVRIVKELISKDLVSYKDLGIKQEELESIAE